MKTLKLTSNDFKNGEYVGKELFDSEYQGSVEIEGGLGYQSIKGIWCSGSLVVGAGTSITAGTYIKAGGSPWEDGKNTSYSTVACVKLESGTVIGTLVEIGLPEEETVNPCHGDEPGPFCRKCGERLEEEGE